MLVDACSNIGQELNKTSKLTDSATQLEARKSRSTSSPSSNGGSKPNSPPPPYSQQQRGLGLSAIPSRVKHEVEAQANKEKLSAAAGLASQYQLMYQQLLYQAELEYLQKSKGLSGSQTALNKAAQEPTKSSACGLCRMTPGFTGYCVHENNNSNTLNQMLAMLNPGSATAAVLAYSNKLATLSQPYLDRPLSAIYPTALKGNDQPRTSPVAHKSGESRRASIGSAASGSPRSHSSPHQSSTEQPMDLHIEKSKSPSAPRRTTLIECHWVGAEGYCGKRFPSQDDLMQHLRHHVANCPNISVSEEESTRNNVNHRRQTSRSPIDRSSHKHAAPMGLANNLLTVGTKHSSPRFQPYSMTDRAFPSALLLGTPR